MFEGTKNYQNVNWLYHQYIVLQKPAIKIAKENNVKRGTIYYWLKKRNISANREFREEWRDRLSKSKEGYVPWNKGKEFMKGESHPNWKGGIAKKMKNRINNYKWLKFRKQIIEERGNICELCGKEVEGSIHIGHLLHPEYYPDIYNELIYYEGNVFVAHNSCHQKLDKNSIRKYEVN